MVYHPGIAYLLSTVSNDYFVVLLSGSCFVSDTLLALTVHHLPTDQHLEQLPPVLHHDCLHTIHQLQFMFIIILISPIPHNQTLIHIHFTLQHYFIVFSPSIQPVDSKLVGFIPRTLHDYFDRLSPDRMFED